MKMNSIKYSTLVFMVLCAGLTLFSFTTFEMGRWEKLGERKVNYALDRDEIFVGAREGFFDALQLKVKRNGVNFHKMAVHYGNGQIDEIELRQNIPAGGDSRVIDLVGNNRIIEKVVFWYDSNNNRKLKGKIELWGHH